LSVDIPVFKFRIRFETGVAFIGCGVSPVKWDFILQIEYYVILIEKHKDLICKKINAEMFTIDFDFMDSS